MAPQVAVLTALEAWMYSSSVMLYRGAPPTIFSSEVSPPTWVSSLPLLPLARLACLFDFDCQILKEWSWCSYLASAREILAQ